MARLLGSLLRYEEGTAGSLMEPAVLAVPARITVGQALERVAIEKMVEAWQNAVPAL